MVRSAAQRSPWCLKRKKWRRWKRAAAPEPQAAPLPQSFAGSPGVNVRQDYEFAERVGTLQAWDSFLSVHTSGFYSDLARAQRAKFVARAEPEPSAARPDVQRPVAQDDRPQESAQRLAVLQPADTPTQRRAEAGSARVDARSADRVEARGLRSRRCRRRMVSEIPAIARSVQSADRHQVRHARWRLLARSMPSKGQRGRICPLVCGSRAASGRRAVCRRSGSAETALQAGSDALTGAKEGGSKAAAKPASADRSSGGTGRGGHCARWSAAFRAAGVDRWWHSARHRDWHRRRHHPRPRPLS